MALRNYLYAKHDNNLLISSKISGNPMQESPEIIATTKKMNTMKITANAIQHHKKHRKHHAAAAAEKKQDGCEAAGECKNCPDCPKQASSSSDFPKTPIEIENTVPRSTEIDYSQMDF